MPKPPYGHGWRKLWSPGSASKGRQDWPIAFASQYHAPVRILVADKLADFYLSKLREHGEVDSRPELQGDALTNAIGDATVLVVRSTRVTGATLDAGSRLGLIVRAGAGVNTIDVRAASEHGVYVANCPGKNAAAVAELTIGLLISLDRKIGEASTELRNGAWKKAEYGKAHGLCGRVLAVAGLGSIGQLVVSRALALGMCVRGFSRSLDDARAAELGIQRAASLVDLTDGAYALSLHLPLTDGTRGCIGDDVLHGLREGGLLINTARGELLDLEAVRRAVEGRGLRVAADAHTGEPSSGKADFTPPLAKLRGTVCTPHIGASTAQAQEAVAEEAVRIVGAFAAGGSVPNCVNLTVRSPARWQIVVRHHDRVGVLASVLNLLRENEINVQEVDNRIFDGAKAAVCRILLDDRPAEELLVRLQSEDDVLHVELTERS